MGNQSSKKRDKSGQRGVPKVDRVNDKEMFISHYLDEDGKRQRVGKFRIAHEICDAMTRIALELKTSRSELVRSVLEEFVKFYDESKSIGGERFFEASKTIEQWVRERGHFKPLLRDMISKDHLMDLESKSPECKLLSQQLVLLAKMMNITNKNVL